MNSESEAGATDGSRGRPRLKRQRASTQAAHTGRGLWAWCLETYATVDPRSLGLFRILFALVLLHDVGRRWPDLADHYSNAGWLTNHFLLYRPMSDHLFSLYLAFSTPSEVHVIAAFHLAVNFFLLIGWRTRLMQCLAFVLIVSLNSRNIMLENGGFVVMHLIALWTMFLPLGQRFSVDALLLSLAQRRETSVEALNDAREPRFRTGPVVALAVPVIILQFACIYYFNVVHKTGSAWRDGSAVYYFFEQDRMVTWFGAWARQHVNLDFVRIVTWSTLVIESLVALCLVSPVYTKRARMIGWALVLCLHFGIDVVVQLGPFSYAMFVIHAIFIPREFWDFWRRRTVEKHGVRVLWLDPSSALEMRLARLVQRSLPSGSVRFGERNAAESRAEPYVTSGAGTETRSEPLRRSRALLALARPSWPLRLGLSWLALPSCQRLLDRVLGSVLEQRARQAPPARAADEGAQGRGEAPPTARALAIARLRRAAGNVVLACFVAACASQMLMENRAIPEALKPKSRPEWMTALVVYPRLFQGWSMFAPDPPRDDGKVVVEGRTKDGRRFDPLSQGVPDYDLNPTQGFEMNQLWGDFHRRIWQHRFRSYWNGFRDYLRNHHELTGHPENELAAFEVYYISEVVPPPGGQRAAPKKDHLFSWGNMRRFDAASGPNSTP
ncbi:MAG TPA: HTTM domain-containing protein [Polyangiaceae bacterium]